MLTLQAFYQENISYNLLVTEVAYSIVTYDCDSVYIYFIMVSLYTPIASTRQ